MAPSRLRRAARAWTAVPAAPASTTAAALRRTVRRLRARAAAAAAAAFGLRLSVRLWLEPAAGRMLPGEVGLAAVFVATLLAAGLPLLWYAVGVRRHRRPPATFLPARRRAAAYVPVSPWSGAYPVGAAALAAGLVPAVPGPGDAGLDGGGAWGALGLWLISAAAAAWIVGRPGLWLSPTGLTLREPWRPWSGRLVPWGVLRGEALGAPAGQPPRLELPLRRLPTRVAVQRVPTPRGPAGDRPPGDAHVPRDAPAPAPPAGAGTRTVPLTWLWVDPAYLTRMIRHYATQAAARRWIGTHPDLRLRPSSPAGTSHRATGPRPGRTPEAAGRGTR